MRWDQLEAAELAVLLAPGGHPLSGFVDSHQWVPLAEAGYYTWGGHPAAQCRRLSASPIQPQAVALLQADGSTRPLASSARELRLELARRCGLASGIGDLHQLDPPVLACLPECAPRLLGAGWSAIQAWPEAGLPSAKVTVASARLDAVVAAAFRVSRGEAHTAIACGFVFLNFRSGAKRTTELRAGDQLVFRGRGRAAVASLSEHSRSGRRWLEYTVYPA